MANKYGKSFVTPNATVTWAHLHKPDVKFGNPNHNITVELTEELSNLINDAAKKCNFSKVSKVNGVSERDGVKLLKVKNSQFAKDNPGTPTFPCFDSQNTKTTDTPFGGDVVRLRLVPALLERDNSMSLYLDGVQIIEKNEQSSAAGGFDKVEGGYVAETATAAMTEEAEPEQGADMPF